MRWMLGVLVALAFAAPAQAELIQDFGGFQSGTNGIVRGPDGNFWVAEEFSDSVARMRPNGEVIGRWSVGDNPTSIGVTSGATVWVSVTGAKKFARFDAASGTQLADVPTPGALCGPVAIADGGNGRVYFSLPNDCGGSSALGSVAANGTNLLTTTANVGRIYDLAVANGKLFGPRLDDGEVDRYTLAPMPVRESAIDAPNGPGGIDVDGSGTAWVTQSNGTIAKFSVVQNGGSVTEVTGGVGGQAFGIVVGTDGNVYVTGKVDGKLARIAPNGTTKFFAVGSEPWQIVNGADGDLYFTDQNSSRVRRFVSSAPRAATGAVAGVSATSATVSASIDSRGNTTDVIFDYGPTSAYGATAVTQIPAAVAAAPVSAVLSGLAPATTYHLRVRATNAEGTTLGSDVTFTTAPGDGDGDGVSPPLDCNDANAAIHPGAVDKPGDKIDQDCSGTDAAFPVLGARANFSWGFSGSRTAFTKVTVSGLKGGETIKITCKSKSKGCPFSSKTYRKVKKGTKSLTSLLGRKRLLKTGAKVEVRVTAPEQVGSSATATVGKRKRDPKISRKRINP